MYVVCNDLSGFYWNSHANSESFNSAAKCKREETDGISQWRDIATKIGAVQWLRAQETFKIGALTGVATPVTLLSALLNNRRRPPMISFLPSASDAVATSQFYGFGCRPLFRPSPSTDPSISICNFG